MRERDIESYLVSLVKYYGGEARKVKWIGRNNAPDRVVFLPDGRLIWVECKAPGKTPTAAQLREHERMRKLGQQVVVVDSCKKVLNLILLGE